QHGIRNFFETEFSRSKPAMQRVVVLFRHYSRARNRWGLSCATERGFCGWRKITIGLRELQPTMENELLATQLSWRPAPGHRTCCRLRTSFFARQASQCFTSSLQSQSCSRLNAFQFLGQILRRPVTTDFQSIAMEW